MTVTREEIINEINSLKESIELNKYIDDEKKLFELYEETIKKYQEIFVIDEKTLEEKKLIYLRSIIRQSLLLLSIKEYQKCQIKIQELIDEKERLNIVFRNDYMKDLELLIEQLKNQKIPEDKINKNTLILKLETFLTEK